MNSKKTKLELTWPGKHKRPRLEPRILLEDKTLSYHAAPRTAPDLVEQAEAVPTFDDNLLIHGDNQRSLVETRIYCFKQLGDKLMARTFDRQVAELHVRAALLNRFSMLPQPETVAVA